MLIGHQTHFQPSPSGPGGGFSTLNRRAEAGCPDWCVSRIWRSGLCFTEPISWELDIVGRLVQDARLHAVQFQWWRNMMPLDCE